MPDANLALISVPGDFAAAEALKALSRGLHVMIFSDNVGLDDEAMLKREAASRGLLVMGPDCGTAIIAGTPLAFANVVPRGSIGLVGASGTGLQEVSCLIAQGGGGISHAIGTGGRDLKKEIGGLTTIAALDALDADPATRHIVVVSKPPGSGVAGRIIERLARSPKTVTLCLLGAGELTLPRNVRQASTLEGAADRALEAVGIACPAAAAASAALPPVRGPLLRGLFSGGTLCTEAQIVLRAAGFDVASNVPIAGAKPLAESAGRHVLIDLGDDEFTRGRPHPMIEPAVRDAPMREALADPAVGVLLIDVVLGFGGHMDPAGHIAGLQAAHQGSRPLVVASVTGTEGDPQVRSRQVARLEAAGVRVAPSNAAAARLATEALGKSRRTP